MPAPEKLEEEASRLRRVLAKNPRSPHELLRLGEIHLELGRPGNAFEHFALALDIRPSDRWVQSRLEAAAARVRRAPRSGARVSEADSGPVSRLVDQPDGKISLHAQCIFSVHRSGWNFALEALRPLHHTRGALFDGVIENNFAWNRPPAQVPRPPPLLEIMRRHRVLDRLASLEEQGVMPYRRPWVGVVHNPHDMEPWIQSPAAPRTIFASDLWKRSVEHCRGLFTLTEEMAGWLRRETGLPVSAVVHPTEIPEKLFEMEKFLQSSPRDIVQVGWWLRDLDAIRRLPIPKGSPAGYRKIFLVPGGGSTKKKQMDELRANQARIEGTSVDPRYGANTIDLETLSNEDYDELLSRSVVFLRMNAAVANNAVIECIARGTPLLINPLPSAVEYLGADYPFYYANLEEAAEKAMDLALVEKTHHYLLTCSTRARLSAESFLEQVRTSEVYRRLPSIPAT